MVKSSKNTEKYIPKPIEAAALKELGQPYWRFYESKEDFEKVVEKFENQNIKINGKDVNAWCVACCNAFVSIGIKPETYSTESLTKAEQELKKNKPLWKKVQAAHLYNYAGFKPEIDLSDNKLSADDILQKISENLDKMEKGQIVDGKYQPSKAEKAVLRTLGNYGEFTRDPKSEDEIAKFSQEIKQRFGKIGKREDYQTAEPKSPKKQHKKTNRKDNTMSDDKEFKLSDEQLEFCKAHGIETTSITSEEAYKEAVKQFSNENADSQKDDIKTDDKDNKKDDSQKTTENGGKDDEKDESKDDKEKDDKNKKPLQCDIKQPEPEEKTDEKTPEWVVEKAKWYAAQAQEGKIQGYEQDTTKEGFAAKLENAEIHYSSPDNVTVSPDAGYKVFDTMLKEPDNQGRPIEFPDNASKEVATRLYAACVLNGNPMQGAVPTELDAETLAKSDLSEEQIKQVQDHLEASQKKNDGQQKNGEEKTGEEKPVEEKTGDEKAKQREDLKNAFALGYQPQNADFYKRNHGFTDEEIKPLEGAERKKLIDSLSSEQILDISKLVDHDLKKELEGIYEIKQQIEPLKQDMENAAKLGIAPEKYGAVLENGQLAEIDKPNDIKPLEGDERKDFLENTPVEQLSAALEKTKSLKKPTSEQQTAITELKQTIVTKAINEQTQAKEELHQMIKDGKVSLVKDEKTGKVEMTANDQKDLKRALLLTANIKSTQEAALKANGNNNEQYRQQQIANLRSRLNPEQAKSRQEKEDARDLVMAARLGIAPKDAKVTDHSGQEVKAKTGEDLKKYQSNLSKETMARLTQKFKGAEK